MGGLKEFGIPIARVVLAMVVLIEGLIVLDILMYISYTSTSFTARVAAAYDDGYDEGYAQTYDIGYQEVYGEAYDKGYDKGYEIGLGSFSKEGVAVRVELRNPTYKELKEFLIRDKTDNNIYIEDEYVCYNFAAELNNNAEANGIRAAYVRIRSTEWAHVVVAFETVDRGLVFIEPQSDRDIELVVGKPYQWWQAGASSPLKYSNVVEEIQIIW